MKWIITGGAGFIGSHTAAHLLHTGHEVVVVDNLSRPGTDTNISWLKDQGLKQFLKSDVRHQETMNDIMDRHQDADVVLHLAAQTAVTTSVVDSRTDFETNALGTFNVLEAVRLAGGSPAVLYSSTNKVYGNLSHFEVAEKNGRYELPARPHGISESEPLDFHSPYGCSKGCGDQYVRDYSRIYGLKTVVLRQSCIYGTRQMGMEDQGWISWFCHAAIHGWPLRIYGDGKQVRDALCIDDLIDLYLRVANQIEVANGQVYNIGGGHLNTLSLLDLVSGLEVALGKHLEPGFASWRPGDQRVFVSDNMKAGMDLDWYPTVSVGEGVTRLIDWHLKN